MCGIVGFVARRDHDPADAGLEVRRMLSMIRHRGPDQFGVYQDSAAALGSARLSIIDLGGGQQPICNEDGTLWIVFNGEIFNYVELRPDLEKRGHRFTTQTDTEVLLHAYEEFGTDCFERLNGQFAFAIWDSARRRLLLGRDRMGIRPLFYTEVAGALVFASEIKSLLAYPGITAAIDPVSLDQIFTYWSPLPGRSAFHGIHQLPPGHFLLRSQGETHVKRYWALDYQPDNTAVSEDAQFEQFEALLTDATLIRLRSDVPVGAYLSGGLDSSIVTRIIASQPGVKLTTFSVTFEDPDFDESEFQLRMSSQLGARHEIVHATHADIANVFPEVIWHTEIPVMRTAPAPMFLLSRLAHESGFKVVMTGEGADEVLGGYDIFKEAAIRRFWARNPDSRMRPLLLKRLYSDIPGMTDANDSFRTAFFRMGLSETESPFYSHMVRWRNNARTRRFFSQDVLNAVDHHFAPALPERFTQWGPLERAQYLEATLLLSEYLLSSQGDRMAMAHSVESRLPFLDYRVVEFCGGLPARLKLRGLTEKYLLKRLGRKLLPEELWRRPKRPYRAPIHKSLFCESMPDYVHELLAPARIRAAGYFKPAAVAQLFNKAASGAAIGETDDMALAGILSTQLTHFQFVSNFAARPPLEERDNNIKIRGACLAARG